MAKINLKKLVLNMVETQKQSLLDNGYKQIPDFEQYYINEDGNIIRLKEDGGLTEVPMSLNKCGRYKVNLINSNNKQITVIVHRALYQTFKGAIDSDIEFIDGDATNVTLKNLITTQELLDFYRKANNILLPGQEAETANGTASEEEAANDPASEDEPQDTASEEKTEEITPKDEKTEEKAKSKKSTKKNNVRVLKTKEQKDEVAADTLEKKNA